jgi:hypothetical protein
MPAILKTVLTEAVKVVHFIKSRAMNSRLFSILCNEMSSETDKLLLHTKVRWLSWRNVLSRLSELRSEVQIFLSDTTSDLSNRFTDKMWLSQLTYLADIFCRLNELRAYRVSILHHSQSTTKRKLSEKYFVSLSKK